MVEKWGRRRGDGLGVGDARSLLCGASGLRGGDR